MAEEDLSLARDFAAKLQKVAEGVPLARVSALPPSALRHGQPEPGVAPPPSPHTHAHTLARAGCPFPFHLSAVASWASQHGPIPHMKHPTMSASGLFTLMSFTFCARTAAAAASCSPVAGSHRASSRPSEEMALTTQHSMLHGSCHHQSTASLCFAVQPEEHLVQPHNCRPTESVPRTCQ